MGTIFGVKKIPSDTQIRMLLDRIAPDTFGGLFNETLQRADKYKVLDRYRVLDGGVLIALDRVWYHTTQKIHCKRCLHKSKDGVTMYYHTILVGTIVKPGETTVLPVMVEMIRNEDGEEEQDCQRNAMKRWLSLSKPPSSAAFFCGRFDKLNDCQLSSAYLILKLGVGKYWADEN